MPTKAILFNEDNAVKYFKIQLKIYFTLYVYFGIIYLFFIGKNCTCASTTVSDLMYYFFCFIFERYVEFGRFFFLIYLSLIFLKFLKFRKVLMNYDAFSSKKMNN